MTHYMDEYKKQGNEGVGGNRQKETAAVYIQCLKYVIITYHILILILQNKFSTSVNKNGYA